MIVVSDTSALSALFLIQRIDILPALYGQVIVPPSVMRELLKLETRFGKDLSGLKSASWLTITSVTDVPLFQKYRRVLDEGESEALTLMHELSADLLLIDEMLGRKIAQMEGIAHTGVLGVLLSAKAKGLLDFIRPALHDLTTMAGFRISNALYERVLRQAGEAL